MFEISSVQTLEGSRIYGETAYLHKQAFEVSLDPGLIAGSLAGGYAAKRHYDKRVVEQEARTLRQQQHEQRNRLIENDSFAQTQQLLDHLKILFTPINVIYMVNNQTFEIIRIDEMTPVMKQAFQEKDAMFFRDLLVKKMNMELQLVQQAFAQRMLAGHSMPKQAGFRSIGELLLNEEDAVFEKRASETTAIAESASSLTYTLSLDGIRPFESHAFFAEPDQFEKVANLFDDKVLERQDIEHALEVGFLPDRVVYLMNGQMIEQLPLIGMNEEGYQAFRKRDKDFFRTFYSEYAQKQESHLMQERMAREVDDVFEKQAKDVQEVVEENMSETLAINPIKSKYRFFEDYEIHPLLYYRLLEAKYPEWRTLSLEALIGQMERDFKTDVSQIAFDKIAMIKTVTNSEQTLFLSDFTYEKFVRAMAGKPVDFTLYQGNVTLGEIIFANDMADILTNGENFIAFDDSLIDFTVNNVTDEGIRFVMPLLVSEDPDKRDDEINYYVIVNGLLERIWKEADSENIFDAKELAIENRFSEDVIDVSLEILETQAEKLDLLDVETSVSNMVQRDARFHHAVALHVASTIDATEYLQVQQKMLVQQLDSFENDWGLKL